MDEWKEDAHIPEFGNWDLTNDFPITRYFECTTQPRLLRYTSSSAETRLHHKPPLPLRNHTKQDTRNKGKRSPHGNANKGKVYVVKEQARKTDRRRKHMQVQQDDTVPRTPKPVDEDLYKIPPELLHTSNKRKKIMGFISKCFVQLSCHEHC
ncbi:uncharacterized protein LOC114192761 [Vigna unguiculata]|uniref:uncharacterized protein LOC114192761 n=1 Tax=Vigna unguiculata TaxID=3917 RepID=UPI0010169A73|nr:uncharacterized protein LOC114192761 [Vigna unguiculata]